MIGGSEMNQEGGKRKKPLWSIFFSLDFYKNVGLKNMRGAFLVLNWKLPKPDFEIKTRLS